MTLKDILLKKGNPTHEVVEALASVCNTYEIEKGEILVKQGEMCHKIYFISEGLFRIMHEKDNKEDTVVFGGAGEVFLSFHTYVYREPSVFSLHCLERSTGWYTSIDKFKALLLKFPELAEWWGNVLASQIAAIEQLYSLFSLVDAEQRIENFWTIVNPDLQQSHYRKTFNLIPMKYFAQYIGITPQSLSRLRRKILNSKILRNKDTNS